MANKLALISIFGSGKRSGFELCGLGSHRCVSNNKNHQEEERDLKNKCRGDGHII